MLNETDAVRSMQFFLVKLRKASPIQLPLPINSIKSFPWPSFIFVDTTHVANIFFSDAADVSIVLFFIH